MDEYWWCEHCQEEVASERVTYEEAHDSCGYLVIRKKKRNLKEVAELINNEKIEGVVNAKAVLGFNHEGKVEEYLEIEFEDEDDSEALERINWFIKKLEAE